MAPLILELWHEVGMGKFYTLKNKDEKVLRVKMCDNVFTEIEQVYNPELLPFGVKEIFDFMGIYKETVSVTKLSAWWKNSSIPIERDSIRLGLECLGIKDTEELRILGLGLSLSNHYWLEPEGELYRWKDVNYYENDFSDEVGIALFNHKPVNTGKIGRSPDAALNGQLQKKWIIENGKRVLVKKGEIRTINEVFASHIAAALQLDCVNYSIAIEDNEIVCKCNCFTDNDWEFIPGTDILNEFPNKRGVTSYKHYVNTLESLGIQDACEYTDKMMCLDYVIRNTDRHYNNLGVLYNRELGIYKNVPVFDSGESMHNGMVVINDDDWMMRPFSHTGALFEPAKEHIQNVTVFYSVQKQVLDELLEEYCSLALTYGLTSDKRINEISHACRVRNLYLQQNKEAFSKESMKKEQFPTYR